MSIDIHSKQFIILLFTLALVLILSIGLYAFYPSRDSGKENYSSGTPNNYKENKRTPNENTSAAKERTEPVESEILENTSAKENLPE